MPPGQPLPMVHEQQEQRFLNTLWSGGWRWCRSPLANNPRVATPCPMQRSSHRRAAGGQRTREPSVELCSSLPRQLPPGHVGRLWHMVPLSTVPRVGVDESRTTGFGERDSLHEGTPLAAVAARMDRVDEIAAGYRDSRRKVRNAGERDGDSRTHRTPGCGRDALRLYLPYGTRRSCIFDFFI